MTVRAAADIRVYQSDCDNLKISSRTGAERYRQFGGTRPKTRLLVFKNEGETKMAEFFLLLHDGDNDADADDEERNVLQLLNELIKGSIL